MAKPVTKTFLAQVNITENVEMVDCKKKLKIRRCLMQYVHFTEAGVSRGQVCDGLQCCSAAVTRVMTFHCSGCSGWDTLHTSAAPGPNVARKCKQGPSCRNGG